LPLRYHTCMYALIGGDITIDALSLYETNMEIDFENNATLSC
jgi:hypothetical protein